MVEKELRKLNRRDLLKILLIQCEEAEELQKEADAMKEELDAMQESYERLKKKLDIKDERLNEKDARIAELSREIEELKKAGSIEQGGENSVTEALNQLNEVFEVIQKSVKPYVEKEKETGAEQSPFNTGRTEDAGKNQMPPHGQIISVNFGKAVSNRKQKEAPLKKITKVTGVMNG